MLLLAKVDVSQSERGRSGLSRSARALCRIKLLPVTHVLVNPWMLNVKLWKTFFCFFNFLPNCWMFLLCFLKIKFTDIQLILLGHVTFLLIVTSKRFLGVPNYNKKGFFENCKVNLYNKLINLVVM